MSETSRPVLPTHFINRELSWLEFNQRVLDEAMHPDTPLLERLKFLGIVSSNLDEFFEVRVAGLKQSIESEAVVRSVDGRTATETFNAVIRRVRRLVDDQYACWRNEIRPALERKRIRIVRFGDLSQKDSAWVNDFFRQKVFPVLTPLGLDPSHPFPQLFNKTLNIIVRLEGEVRGHRRQHLAIVQVPKVLPRLIALPREGSRRDYIFLGHVICRHMTDLFPGMEVLGYWTMRVTRNSELYIDEEEIANLLKAVEREVHNRRKGDAVRLELSHTAPPDIQRFLLRTLRLGRKDLYLVDGPLNPQGMMSIYGGDHSPELREAQFVAPRVEGSGEDIDLFKRIRKGDMLLHHPYESFETVVALMEKAAADPDVLAIKQTLYRTGGDRRIVGALMDAVKNGKEVTAVVELKARFDEENNIKWARMLERAGVHVVYGIVGFKIHCKTTLIVRAEGDGIRRYVHLGTGNYNATTARLYTDLSLLTCRPEFGEDVTNVFNLLTGICQYQPMRKLIVAPFTLKPRMIELIRREADNAEKGIPARIVAKMNSLVDPTIIRELYAASRAGVRIDLVVRGICCLRPGVRGLSETIQVRSIIDRFLEHSRIFYFENGCVPEVFIGSADWMPRNLERRIEVVFPIEDGVLRDRVINEILRVTLADNVKAGFLDAKGVYSTVDKKGSERRSQTEFLALARDKAAKNDGTQDAPRPQRMTLAKRPAVLDS